jgi:ASPIC and UnbV/FG-GAP-like repeat
MLRLFYTNILIFFSFTGSILCQPMVNVSSSIGLNYSAGTTEGGSGASFVDFDNDGFDDLTIGTQGGDSILFFKNNGIGAFTKLPAMVNHTGLSRQILWVDIDNDNDLDLYVNTGIQTGSAQNRLYERTPSGLIDITLTSGLALVQDNSYGATFADIDKDGDLDLYVSVLFGHTDILYRNNGNKTFTNINVSSGIGNDDLPDFCAAFFDYDNDGDVDLYTINDKYAAANRLYQNDNTGHFTEVGASTGSNIAIDAMNAGVADFNNDGYFDVYVTNTSGGNQLLLNNFGYFVDVAATSGVTVNQLCWGAGFFDADNDKDLDLYVCSENAYVGDRNRFYKNKLETGDAIFEEYQSGGLIGDTLNSYVMANGDFNNDGKPDIVVVNDQNDPIFLWKNNISNNKNYVKLKLEGTTSNKNAIGTLIKIYDGDSVQHRYTNCGINFMTQNSLTEHIGMGTNTKIDSIIVKWPNGSTNKYYNLGVNQTFKLKEGSCLNHDYNFNNTSANKFNFNTTNLNSPSNWSKGHLPLITEDVEIVNSGALTNLSVPGGMTLNCQSLVIKGSINFENNGIIEVRSSNGVGLNIFDTGVTFTNNNLINIRKACGNGIKNKGSFIEKGTTKILKQ